MIAYIILIALATISIYLYSKNNKDSNKGCANCKGCDK